MKRNAIIQIILWSIVIVILCSIMASVMLGWNFRAKSWTLNLDAPIGTSSVELATTPADPTLGILNEDVKLFAAPSPDATPIEPLKKGDTVEVSSFVDVESGSWALVLSPSQTLGWIMEKYIDIQSNSVGHSSVRTENFETPIYETEYINVSGDTHNFSPTGISELKIEWVAGDILIQPTDTDQITVKEDGVSDEKYAMVLRQSGNTLKIQFCEDTAFGFGIHFNTPDITKDLTILVPKDWQLDSLEIDCASATVEVNDMTIREVDFDGASGTCEFENCTVEEMDIDTASGDVKFVGSLGMLDCDAASASVYAVLSNTPRRLDMDSMSGDLEIILPEDAGFTLALTAMSSDFTSDFETTMKNGNYVCGDGSCRINVDALSGDVIIRKSEA